ncbi:Uma2 family endonuclease [Oscillatoria salina]|uniref:Uma2 family endonuclease n=1 Tax=Oscillatoria salina TaxID=331517 RepID=UPI0013B87B80|nr:Uma2 family endonuclease [Oscillatoria salina]MBZ8178788.1 Uma2 family endonuclease [Oscillatoria salina IIICB1]NET88219.1 Uma2 family endonuclease [Kamptonema sp. SIO1D9]
MSETVPAQYNLKLPPTQKELPCDDGIPMETARHKAQMDLLMETLSTWLDARDDGFVGGNMFIYFSLAQVRNQDFRGPDFFAVLDVPKGERLSWVVWEEGKAPDVVIELISETTKERDKNEKKRIYQNQMRVPEYFWYDPFNPDDWAGFALQNRVYRPIAPNHQNQLISESLGLVLLRWEGRYHGIEATWLRWATLEGELLLTDGEMRDRERSAKELAEQRAAQLESQLQQVVRNLRQQGMTVTQIASITGLSDTQIEAINP